MKKVKYPNLDDYDLSCYEELKGDILYRINGGAEIENSVEAQAQAHEGDTVKRSDGTTHTLTKGDITWAQNQLGNNGGGSSGGSATGNIGDVGGGNASASMGTSAPAGGGQSTGNATATSGNNSAGSTGNYAGGNGNAGNNSRSTKSASEQDHYLKVGLAHVEDYKRTSLAIGTIGVKGKKVEGNSVSERSIDLRNRGFPLSTERYPDAYGPDKVNLSVSIDKNSDAEYNKDGNGFKCDNWVEKVLKDEGIDPSRYLTAGDSSKTVAEHIAALRISGNNYTMTVPTESGFYCTFMDGEGSKGLLPEHCGILEVKANGSMVFHHNSSAATEHFTGGGYGNWKTEPQKNGTKLSGLAYSNFYFQRIER